MKLRLKQIRQSKRLTLDQLAARVGMSKSYVSEIENERKQVNGRRLEAFAAALDVSVHDLIGDATEDTASDIVEHIEIMRALTTEDRREVERLALFLAKREGGGSS
jgi:transcriptional regulator with XRE-family HTH domain